MEFFLAWRYFKPRRNAVSLITLISLVGVALGVAVLIVVLAVMTGFTDLMKKKLLETTSHIQIENDYYGYIQKPKPVMEIVKKLGAEAVPVTIRQVLVQRGEKFEPKTIIGIDPGVDKSAVKFNLADMIRYGKLSLNSNEVLVSTRIANQLRLGLGSRMLIHSPAKIARMINVTKQGQVSIKKNSDVYLPSEFTITGMFSFNKYDFDSQVIFVNRDDANDMFDIPWGGCTSVFVWTDDPFHLDGIEASLKKQLPGDYSVITWQEKNSMMLGALQMEKSMMFFLLIFIVLVAAFSITNTLITVVVQKTREIGLLKALGSSSRMVMSIFLMQGFFVGIIGALMGTGLGITIIYFRNNILQWLRESLHMHVFPPELYFFNQLPARIIPSDVALIVVISVILCTLGAVIPAWRAARLEPAQALRNE